MATQQIFDLHCDTLDSLAWPVLPTSLNLGKPFHDPRDEGKVAIGQLLDFGDASRGHLSLPRMATRPWCQCLAVFIPDPLTVNESAQFFDVVSGTLPRHLEAHPDELGVARSTRQVDDIMSQGKTCGILTIENGKLLAASPDMVEHIDAAGVRMVTITWNAENPLASGHDTQQGLTSLGRSIIGQLEARHIAVDVSHLNDPGFDDVRRVATAPFCASHSNSRAVCDVPRNLTDDQFRAIRDAGGVVGLNYCNHFITTDDTDPTPQQLIAHVIHFLDLGGEDVLALGSDYDGCTPPSWLVPADKITNLVDLLVHEVGESLTQKICFDNARAFFDRVEASS